MIGLILSLLLMMNLKNCSEEKVIKIGNFIMEESNAIIMNILIFDI